MAINQNALNVVVLNGTTAVLNTQNLTATSTSAISLNYARLVFKNIIASVTSTTSSIAKGYYLVLSVIKQIFVGSGSLNGNALNISAINAQATGVVSSLVTLATNFFYYKTFTATSSIGSTLSRIVVPLNTFLITVMSASSVTKGLSKTIDLVLSTVTSTMQRALILPRTLTVNCISLVTLIAVRIYYRTLSVVSNTTNIIVNSIQKTLTILVNCGIILVKDVRKLITVIVTSTVTMIRSAISFIRYPLNRLIYAASKIRKVFYK